MWKTRSGIALLSAISILIAGCVPPTPTRVSSTTTVAAYSPVGKSYQLPHLPPDSGVGNISLVPNLDEATPAAVLPSAVDPQQPESTGAITPESVALEILLPTPVFRGTTVPANEPFAEPPVPRSPFFAPVGTLNLALGKTVTASDAAPLSGELDFVVDGDKEATDDGCLVLRPGSEWVQVDLASTATIYAVLVWHNHAEGRVYRDVIVQVSEDPDFLTSVTVFNNDYDNSSGLGIGTDMAYVETFEGRLIDCQGVTGRYVRLHTRGNHLDDKNHYTEVEVYGKL